MACVKTLAKIISLLGGAGMARTSLVRVAAGGGVLVVALAAGSGIASAAPYGGSSASGVTTSGGGAATFTGSGFGPGTAVTLTDTYCGSSHTYHTTAGSNGGISVLTTGAGQTSYSATGTDGDGLPLTETSSAVLDATCPGGGGVSPGGGGVSPGGGGVNGAGGGVNGAGGGVNGAGGGVNGTGGGVNGTGSGVNGTGGGVNGTGGGVLPFTGFEVGAASAIGLGAIGAGTAVVVISRRRRRGEATP